MAIFPDFGDGSCINCGFLAYATRVHPEGFELINEVPIEVRASEADAGGRLRCFVHAAPLHEETGGLVPTVGVLDREKVRAMLQRGRHCPSWYPFQPGFDPRWHYEELRASQLEANRRSFEEVMEKRSQDFQLKLFEISRKVQADSKTIAERSEGFNRRMTYFFISLAALEVIGTLAAVFVALAFPDGVQRLAEWFR